MTFTKSRKRGVALVLVLAFVVLLTGMVVAYFSRTMTDRQLSNTSFTQSKADQLARSAADVIIGDLKQEIVNGSTETNSNGRTIYKPTSPANMLPLRSGNPGGSPDPIPNLVRRSVGPDNIAAPGVGSRASTLSTSASSLNGRSVSLARWNKHYLIPQKNPGTPTDTTPVAGFTAPDWVFVTNQGPQVISAPNPSVVGRYAYAIYDEGGLLDANAAGYPSTATPAQIGSKPAIAYADLKQVGMSASAVNDLVGWRNYATLQPPGAFAGFTSFPAAAADNYFSFVLSNPSGFLKVNNISWNNRTDQAFLSRQQMLAYCSAVNFTRSALQYLGTFSRELNAPSWGPMQDASAMGGSDGTGSPAPYAYETNADNAIMPNRFIPNVRVIGTFTRAWGEQAVVDEPLIKTRFPLSRLAGLGFTGINTTSNTTMVNGTPASASATTIQRDFGLVWDATNVRWNYVGNAGATIQTTIKTLAQVAADNREPNFFELLKAGILSGSLGNSSDFESFCANMGEDSNADYQIIQIGANIIDQADSDSYPTRIAFGKEMDPPENVILAKSTSNAPVATADDKVFAGVEDLPYLQSILLTPYRRPEGQPNLNPTAIDPVQNAPRDYINCWAQFVLWKPQQQSAISAAPNNLRVLYSGTGAQLQMKYPAKPPGVEYPVGSGIKYGNDTPSGDYPARYTEPALPSGTTIDFTDAPGSYRVPTLLGGMGASSTVGFNCSQPNGNGGGTGAAQLPRGMWMGETYRPQKLTDPAFGRTTAPDWDWVEFQFSNESRFELQYQDGTGAWRTYQRFDRVGMGSLSGFHSRGTYGFSMNPNGAEAGPGGNKPLAGNGFAEPAFSELDIAALGVSTADPRSQRFGLMAMYIYNFAPNTLPAGDWKYYLKQGWIPNASGGSAYWAVFYPSNARFTPSWTGGTVANAWSTKGSTPASTIAEPTSFWADNPGSGSFYKDPDGVARRADGDSVNNVRPMQLASATAANTQDLGLVINRPFRSVGELSYAFRDMPWKSLDFFSANSADSALLDLFSVNEQPAVVAGKVNLNTRNPAVLQSILTGALREELDVTKTVAATGVAATSAATMAARFVTNTSDTSGAADTGPLQNSADLAKRLALILPVTNSPNQAIKTRREVIGRALAGSGQTRTWTLLVDVIAQSGRFAATSNTLDQFIVEGEKRYWLHVAIDRFTGQVIDQQLEPVIE